ncbi:MAG TPA: methyltransferase domain-containing protein [Candidatus Dormibacteraeota bacterium]
MPDQRGGFVDHLLDFYAHTAAGYDGWSNGVHARAAAQLAAFADVHPNERVLDVGCGTGLVTRRLGAQPGAGGLTVGVDISPHLLAVASAQGCDAITYVRMPAGQLGFRRRSFDVVTMGQVLPYLTDPDEALAQAYRVIRRGGRVTVSCERRRLATPAQELFFAALARLHEDHPLRLPRLPEDHAVFGEPHVLTEMLKQTGFTHVRVTQLVTGDRTSDARAWTDLMMTSGPFAYALLSVLGSGKRAEFERGLDEEMQELGEGAYRYHHAFTFAAARRP